MPSKEILSSVLMKTAGARWKSSSGIMSRRPKDHQSRQDGRILYTLPFDSELIGSDLSGQEHIRELTRTRKPVLSSVFAAVQGFRAIALYVPVIKEGEFLGGLGFLLDFERISRRYLQDITIGNTGYAWMIDKSGIELYCPVPGHTGNLVFDNCRDFPAILSMAKEMLKGKRGVTTYLFDRIRGEESSSVRKHAVYLPVKIANTFWSIVVANRRMRCSPP